MEFKDFPRFLGKSGKYEIHPPKLCASLDPLHAVPTVHLVPGDVHPPPGVPRGVWVAGIRAHTTAPWSDPLHAVPTVHLDRDSVILYRSAHNLAGWPGAQGQRTGVLGQPVQVASLRVPRNALYFASPLPSCAESKKIKMTPLLIS